MIGGKQELLCKAKSKADRKGRDRADEELQKKLALRQSLGYNATIVGVLEEFLSWSQKNQAHSTYYGHHLYLQDFLDQAEVEHHRDRGRVGRATRAGRVRFPSCTGNGLRPRWQDSQRKMIEIVRDWL
jgi:hypothetical protein